MKLVLFSLIATTAVATAAVAAPLMNAAPGRYAPAGAVIPVAEDALPNSGTVTEVHPAGSYTYLQVEKDGIATWMAIPRRDVPVGARVRYSDGPLMVDFFSRSLNRNFEKVMFLQGVEVVGETAPSLPSGHPPMPAEPGNAAAAAPALPAGHPPTSKSTTAATLPNSGKVTEVIAAAQYTYLKVARDGVETWLAVPRLDIAVGSEIRYGDGAVMKDFHSTSLNRTFEQVLFVGGVVVTER